MSIKMKRVKERFEGEGGRGESKGKGAGEEKNEWLRENTVLQKVLRLDAVEEGTWWSS